MVAWRNDFVQVNKFTRPAIKIKKVKKIVLHWTANPGASAFNHQKYFNGVAIKSKVHASAHIFVDTKEAICIIPLNEIAYHSNDNYEKNKKGEVYRGIKELSPNANNYSIGVEMCVEKDGIISPITLKRTIEVIADLCKMYNLTEKDIVRHYDVTHKPCPKPFVDKPDLLEDFKIEVGKLLCKVQIVFDGILKFGSTGEDVKRIQKKLGLDDDGVFGKKTLQAVKDYQFKKGLIVDGIVGQNTWNKLFV